MDVSQPDWVIWTWRVFSSHQHSLTYLIHCPLWYQKDSVARLVKALAYRYWDLGSIPRSPPFSILFCFIYFHAASPSVVYHTLNAIACQMSQAMNLKARMKGPSYTSVNHAHVNAESQTGQASIGPNYCWSYLQNWVYHPSCLYFSPSFFFLFFLFVLI